MLFNDTSLLSRREWRSRAVPVADGFMFEAAETPEEKLFNMQLGQLHRQSHWTYVGSHTEYNREHMKDQTMRGWFSYPVESQELLIDGATAMAAGVGTRLLGTVRASSTSRKARWPMRADATSKRSSTSSRSTTPCSGR